MKSDNFNKTRRFVEKGIIFWFIMIAIFLFMQYSVPFLEDMYIKKVTTNYIKLLSGVVLVYGIIMVPFILIMSVLLLYAEIGLNKLVDWQKNRKEK